MLSCRDGAMQHCQQAPVSNEFSTAVLADSVAARGGELFIQYYSHTRICHGHPLPQSHLVRWTFFHSLTLLVLFTTSFERRIHSVSQMHLAKESATCPTLLSPLPLSLCINSAGSTFIKTGVQMGHGRSHTCRGHLFPNPPSA